MFLEGAKLVSVDSEYQEYLAKGRTFTIGYYATCDFIVSDKRAQGVHCIIECDPFDSVTIRNLCADHPILLNGFPVNIKRALFPNSTLNIFGKTYLWKFPKMNSSVCEGLEDIESSTALHTLQRNKRGRSCPNFKIYREMPKRLTIHHFAYCIKAEDVSETNVTKAEVRTFNDKPGGIDEADNISEAQISNIDDDPEVNLDDKKLVSNPERDAEKDADKDASKTDMINATNNKVNLSSEKKKKLLLSCEQSDVLITSYSPRVAGFNRENSYTTIMKPTTPLRKIAASTPKSIFSRTIAGINDDSSYCSPNAKRKQTPCSSVPAKSDLSINLQNARKSSMYLIDFTTPTRLRPLSPRSSARGASVKRNVTSKMLSCNDKEFQDNQTLPSTSVERDRSVGSVISISSTDTSSVIEVIGDSPECNSNPKISLNVQATKTPTSTYPSLMKRALLTSAKKQIIKANRGDSITCSSPTAVASSGKKTNLISSVGRNKSDKPSLLASDLGIINTSTPLASSSKRSNKLLKNTTCPKKSPLHQIRTSLSNASKISRITKHKPQNLPSYASTSKLSAIKAKSPQAIQRLRLLAKSRKTFCAITSHSTTKSSLQLGQSTKTTTASNDAQISVECRKSIPSPICESMQIASDDLSRTFIIESDNEDDIKHIEHEDEKQNITKASPTKQEGVLLLSPKNKDERQDQNGDQNTTSVMNATFSMTDHLVGGESDSGLGVLTLPIDEEISNTTSGELNNCKTAEKQQNLSNAIEATLQITVADQNAATLDKSNIGQQYQSKSKENLLEMENLDICSNKVNRLEGNTEQLLDDEICDTNKNSLMTAITQSPPIEKTNFAKNEASIDVNANADKVLKTVEGKIEADDDAVSCDGSENTFKLLEEIDDVLNKSDEIKQKKSVANITDICHRTLSEASIQPAFIEKQIIDPLREIEHDTNIIDKAVEDVKETKSSSIEITCVQDTNEINFEEKSEVSNNENTKLIEPKLQTTCPDDVATINDVTLPPASTDIKAGNDQEIMQNIEFQSPEKSSEEAKTIDEERMKETADEFITTKNCRKSFDIFEADNSPLTSNLPYYSTSNEEQKFEEEIEAAVNKQDDHQTESSKQTTGPEKNLDTIHSEIIGEKTCIDALTPINSMLKLDKMLETTISTNNYVDEITGNNTSEGKKSSESVKNEIKTKILETTTISGQTTEQLTLNVQIRSVESTTGDCKKTLYRNARLKSLDSINNSTPSSRISTRRTSLSCINEKTAITKSNLKIRSTSPNTNFQRRQSLSKHNLNSDNKRENLDKITEENIATSLDKGDLNKQQTDEFKLESSEEVSSQLSPNNDAETDVPLTTKEKKEVTMEASVKKISSMSLEEEANNEDIENKFLDEKDEANIPKGNYENEFSCISESPPSPSANNTEEMEAFDKYLKTPHARNIMIPAALPPYNEVNETSENTSEHLMSSELYELNTDCQEAHLYDMLQPITSYPKDLLVTCYEQEGEITQNKSGNVFDTTVGEDLQDRQTDFKSEAQLSSSSFLMNESETEPLTSCNSAGVITDMPKSEIEEWVETLNTTKGPDIFNEEDKDVLVSTSGPTYPADFSSSTKMHACDDKIVDELSSIMPSECHKSSKEDDNVNLYESGSNLLDQTIESAWEEPLLVSDNDDANITDGLKTSPSLVSCLKTYNDSVDTVSISDSDSDGSPDVIEIVQEGGNILQKDSIDSQFIDTKSLGISTDLTTSSDENDMDDVQENSDKKANNSNVEHQKLMKNMEDDVLSTRIANNFEKEDVGETQSKVENNSQNNLADNNVALRQDRRDTQKAASYDSNALVEFSTKNLPADPSITTTTIQQPKADDSNESVVNTLKEEKKSLTKIEFNAENTINAGKTTLQEENDDQNFIQDNEASSSGDSKFINNVEALFGTITSSSDEYDGQQSLKMEACNTSMPLIDTIPIINENYQQQSMPHGFSMPLLANEEDLYKKSERVSEVDTAELMKKKPNQNNVTTERHPKAKIVLEQECNICDDDALKTKKEHKSYENENPNPTTISESVPIAINTDPNINANIINSDEDYLAQTQLQTPRVHEESLQTSSASNLEEHLMAPTLVGQTQIETKNENLDITETPSKDVVHISDKLETVTRIKNIDSVDHSLNPTEVRNDNKINKIDTDETKENNNPQKEIIDDPIKIEDSTSSAKSSDINTILPANKIEISNSAVVEGCHTLAKATTEETIDVDSTISAQSMKPTYTLDATVVQKSNTIKSVTPEILNSEASDAVSGTPSPEIKDEPKIVLVKHEVKPANLEKIPGNTLRTKRTATPEQLETEVEKNNEDEIIILDNDICNKECLIIATENSSSVMKEDASTAVVAPLSTEVINEPEEECIFLEDVCVEAVAANSEETGNSDRLDLTEIAAVELVKSEVEKENEAVIETLGGDISTRECLNVADEHSNVVMEDASSAIVAALPSEITEECIFLEDVCVEAAAANSEETGNSDKLDMTEIAAVEQFKCEVEKENEDEIIILDNVTGAQECLNVADKNLNSLMGDASATIVTALSSKVTNKPQEECMFLEDVSVEAKTANLEETDNSDRLDTKKIAEVEQVMSEVEKEYKDVIGTLDGDINTRDCLNVVDENSSSVIKEDTTEESDNSDRVDIKNISAVDQITSEVEKENEDVIEVQGDDIGAKECLSIADESSSSIMEEDTSSAILTILPSEVTNEPEEDYIFLVDDCVEPKPENTEETDNSDRVNMKNIAAVEQIASEVEKENEDLIEVQDDKDGVRECLNVADESSNNAMEEDAGAAIITTLPSELTNEPEEEYIFLVDDCVEPKPDNTEETDNSDRVDMKKIAAVEQITSEAEKENEDIIKVQDDIVGSKECLNVADESSNNAIEEDAGAAIMTTLPSELTNEPEEECIYLEDDCVEAKAANSEKSDNSDRLDVNKIAAGEHVILKVEKGAEGVIAVLDDDIVSRERLIVADEKSNNVMIDISARIVATPSSEVINEPEGECILLEDDYVEAKLADPEETDSSDKLDMKKVAAVEQVVSEVEKENEDVIVVLDDDIGARECLNVADENSNSIMKEDASTAIVSAFPSEAANEPERESLLLAVECVEAKPTYSKVCPSSELLDMKKIAVFEPSKHEIKKENKNEIGTRDSVRKNDVHPEAPVQMSVGEQEETQCMIIEDDHDEAKPAVQVEFTSDILNMKKTAMPEKLKTEVEKENEDVIITLDSDDSADGCLNIAPQVLSSVTKHDANTAATPAKLTCEVDGEPEHLSAERYCDELVTENVQETPGDRLEIKSITTPEVLKTEVEKENTIGTPAGDIRAEERLHIAEQISKSAIKEEHNAAVTVESSEEEIDPQHKFVKHECNEAKGANLEETPGDVLDIKKNIPSAKLKFEIEQENENVLIGTQNDDISAEESLKTDEITSLEKAKEKQVNIINANLTVQKLEKIEENKIEHESTAVVVNDDHNIITTEQITTEKGNAVTTEQVASSINLVANEQDLADSNYKSATNKEEIHADISAQSCNYGGNENLLKEKSEKINAHNNELSCNPEDEVETFGENKASRSMEQLSEKVIVAEGSNRIKTCAFDANVISPKPLIIATEFPESDVRTSINTLSSTVSPGVSINESIDPSEDSVLATPQSMNATKRGRKRKQVPDSLPKANTKIEYSPMRTRRKVLGSQPVQTSVVDNKVSESKTTLASTRERRKLQKIISPSIEIKNEDETPSVSTVNALKANTSSTNTSDNNEKQITEVHSKTAMSEETELVDAGNKATDVPSKNDGNESIEKPLPRTRARKAAVVKKLKDVDNTPDSSLIGKRERKVTKASNKSKSKTTDGENTSDVKVATKSIAKKSTNTNTTEESLSASSVINDQDDGKAVLADEINTTQKLDISLAASTSNASLPGDKPILEEEMKQQSKDIKKLTKTTKRLRTTSALAENKQEVNTEKDEEIIENVGNDQPRKRRNAVRQNKNNDITRNNMDSCTTESSEIRPADDNKKTIVTRAKRRQRKEASPINQPSNEIETIQADVENIELKSEIHVKSLVENLKSTANSTSNPITAEMSPVTGVYTTARGRTCKPTAKIEQLMEKERSGVPSYSPSTKRAYVRKCVPPESTQVETAATENDSVTQRDECYQIHAELAVVKEASPPKSVSPCPTPTSMVKGRRGGRKLKTPCDTDESEASTSKKPLLLDAECNEAPSKTSIPTRLVSKRNAAAAAKVRIEEDALAATAVYPPKRTRAKRIVQKTTVDHNPDDATNPYPKDISNTEKDSNGNTIIDDNENKIEKTDTKRKTRKVIAESDEQCSAPKKRTRKENPVDEVADISNQQASTSQKVKGKSERTVRDRKNVHFNDVENKNVNTTANLSTLQSETSTAGIKEPSSSLTLPAAAPAPAPAPESEPAQAPTKRSTRIRRK